MPRQSLPLLLFSLFALTANIKASPVFFDDFEAGLDKWSVTGTPSPGIVLTTGPRGTSTQVLSTNDDWNWGSAALSRSSFEYLGTDFQLNADLKNFDTKASIFLSEASDFTSRKPDGSGTVFDFAGIQLRKPSWRPEGGDNLATWFVFGDGVDGELIRESGSFSLEDASGWRNVSLKVNQNETVSFLVDGQAGATSKTAITRKYNGAAAIHFGDRPSFVDNVSVSYGSLPPNPIDYYGVFLGAQEETSLGDLRFDLREDQSASAIAEAFRTVLAIPEHNLDVDWFDYNQDDFNLGHLWNKIESAKNKMDENDVFLLYVGSHGGVGSATADEATETPEDEAIFFGGGQGFTDDQLYSILLELLPENDKLVFLAACESGGFFNSEPADGDLGDLEKLNGVGIITAAAEGQVGYYNPLTGRTYFSYALEAAITETASDGVLDFQELADYVLNYGDFLHYLTGESLPIIGPTFERTGRWATFDAGSWSVQQFASGDLRSIYPATQSVSSPSSANLILAAMLPMMLRFRRRRVLAFLASKTDIPSPAAPVTQRDDVKVQPN